MTKDRAADPLTIRGVRFPNRVWMSPMAQYSAHEDGRPSDWHSVHYGSRAVGGVGMVMIESTAIGEFDRCTDKDPGIWNQSQIEAHRALTDVIRSNGAVPAVQLQSAGRKSSHRAPWVQSGQNSAVPHEEGGWTPMAPSAIPFGKLTVPHAMTTEEIAATVQRFAAAARNSHDAGYDVVEIHAAHGYLLHQFLSPLSNERTDEYGGTLENRMRFTLEVAEAVRSAFPDDKPVFVRVTSTDWADGGIVIEETVELAKRLHAIGIDLLDVTSGALLVNVPPPAKPALNLEFAERLRAEAGIAVAPVGQISEPEVLAAVFDDSEVDAVFVGRALLRDPYYTLRVLGGGSKELWPVQYHRGV